jgi:hypothetical protein
MALAEEKVARSARSAALRRLAPLAYVLPVALVAWWAWRAFHDSQTFDAGLYYQGGQVAWASGHPEHLYSWSGTPFLAAVMAILSRVISIDTTATLLTAANVALIVAVVTLVLYRLRALLSTRWWWVAAIGLVSFGPMMSTVWWKQFNIVALVLALSGFDLLRKERTRPAAFLIGLSIALKPLFFFLPIVLLGLRRTRRAGAISLGWALALNFAALGLLAQRAHDIGTLSPYPAFHNFVEKSKPANIWACHPDNFAPGSLLCRLVGPQNWTLQHVVVWAGVALLGAWVVDSLRGRDATSWETFCFACPLSVMLSPLAWSHYQIVLAPLFVLLLVRFSLGGASVSVWAGLLVAFVLASVDWQPYGTLIGSARALVSTKAQTQHDLFSVEAVAQFAQYVLVISGVIWYVARQGNTSEAKGLREESLGPT